MNFREGMRRIGRTVGVLGALLTGYVAFWAFSDLTVQRSAQAEFQSLLSLPRTQEIARRISTDKIVDTYIELPPQPPSLKKFFVDPDFQKLGPQEKKDFLSHLSDAELEQLKTQYQDLMVPGAAKSDNPPIKQIRVNEKSEIEWFTLFDGKVVRRTSAPSGLLYLLYPPIVAAGFLLPWGVVRLVTWIFSGFLGSATAGA
jgi:hypothetical protein